MYVFPIYGPPELYSRLDCWPLLQELQWLFKESRVDEAAGLGAPGPRAPFSWPAVWIHSSRDSHQIEDVLSPCTYILAFSMWSSYKSIRDLVCVLTNSQVRLESNMTKSLLIRRGDAVPQGPSEGETYALCCPACSWGFAKSCFLPKLPTRPLTRPTPHKQQIQENHTVASMMEGGHWLFSQLNIYECNWGAN
jgi:hypothetical protein